jgi:predicted O-methyltransferase YrrM
MNSILSEIFSKKSVEDEHGNVYTLHSHTDISQGEKIKELILDIKPKVSLEVGLAYGISSLFILEALTEVNGQKHILIDSGQDIYWKNIGLLNIKRAGYDKAIEFYNRFSFDVLPRLYMEGQRIQFAYLDTTKVFDILFTDTFFISKMLDVGGVFVLDDVSFPAIRKIARFYSQHPSYEIVMQYKPDKVSLKKRLYKNYIYALLKYLPFKDKIFLDQSWISHETYGINYHSIGFKKIKEDDRNWDWYQRF